MVRNRLLSSPPVAHLAPPVEGPAAVDRTSTGVLGLDQLIEGGFPANRAILLCGRTGTGKTMFGLQFLAEGLALGEAAVFISVDEKPRHLVEDAVACLGVDFGPAIERGSLSILDASPYFTATRTGTWTRSGIDARHVASDLVQQVRKLGARRLVIDTITSLVPPGLTRGHAHDYLRSIIQSCEDNLGCTVLLTCRGSRHDPQGTCDAARCLASGITELRLTRRAGDLVRTLSVRKMRGTVFDLAEHRVTIDRGSGLAIVTSLRAPGVRDLFTPRPRLLADVGLPPSDRQEAV